MAASCLAAKLVFRHAMGLPLSACAPLRDGNPRLASDAVARGYQIYTLPWRPWFAGLVFIRVGSGSRWMAVVGRSRRYERVAGISVSKNFAKTIVVAASWRSMGVLFATEKALICRL